MKVIHINPFHAPYFEEGISIAVGYFDGFHLGHQALLKEAKLKAKQSNISSAVLSFSPNPLVTLGKMKEEKYITSLKDREEILEELDFDYFFILDFTKEVANMLPEDFIQLFFTGMNVKEVVCGFDFFFGQRGKGNAEMLKGCSDFNTTVIEQVSKDHEKISTTRISRLLDVGNIEEVNDLLTRPFQIRGNVVSGKQRGRTLGFPTANVDYGSYLLPKSGVYAIKITIDGVCYPGMGNIGLNPTFKDISKPSLEVHIFDYDEDLYGKEVKVQFYKHTRGEVSFASKEALIEQLNQDEKEIKAYFA